MPDEIRVEDQPGGRSSDPVGDRFLALASEQFLRSGYAATTIRDLAREAGVTVHFVYKSFRDKAGVLSAAIRWRAEHDAPDPPQQGSLAHYVRGAVASFRQRATVRALVVEFASAARRDPDARSAMTASQQQAMEAVLQFYRFRQASGDLDPSVDPYALLSLLWAAEFGYGILEAIGIDPGDPAQIAELYDRLLASVR